MRLQGNSCRNTRVENSISLWSTHSFQMCS